MGNGRVAEILVWESAWKMTVDGDAPGETGQQFLERAVDDPTRWDQVKQLANEIGATVDAKDETK
jgi:hypothetical protein